MAKSEQCVASHQAYHDSCNGFISWLRAAREKLATCQDTFGEKTAVVGKIDRLKVKCLIKKALIIIRKFKQRWSKMSPKRTTTSPRKTLNTKIYHIMALEIQVLLWIST